MRKKGGGDASEIRLPRITHFFCETIESVYGQIKKGGEGRKKNKERGRGKKSVVLTQSFAKHGPTMYLYGEDEAFFFLPFFLFSRIHLTARRERKEKGKEKKVSHILLQNHAIFCET